MPSQMIIRIDPAKRKKLNTLSKSLGKTTSEVIRELIDTFIKDHDISGYIDNLWERVGICLQKNDYSQKDISRLIKDSRKAV